MTKNQPEDHLLVGALELCDLPDFGITDLLVRVDTGAATSSLHVDNMEVYHENGQRWVGFDIHPDVYEVQRVIRTCALVKGLKTVKSSSADAERRIVIETLLSLGGKLWTINLTLTDRSEMTYMMLLGREAMAGRIIVDPGRDYVLKTPPAAPFAAPDEDD